MGECLHHLLITDHFINQRRLLPPHLGLHPKHVVGPAGNEPGDKQGQRRQHHNRQGDLPADGQHKQQCAQNGYNTGEQLGKAHQQTVRKLIHVRNNPADDAAGGMGVQIAQGQDLQLAKGLLPHIPDDVIGNPVVEHIHQPLGKSGAACYDADFQQQGTDAGKIHMSGCHNQINGPSDQDGQIKRHGHCSSGKQHGQDQQKPVSADILPHLGDGPLLYLCHITHPPSGTGTGRFPDKPRSFPAAAHVCLHLPLRRPPAPGFDQHAATRRCAGTR